MSKLALKLPPLPPGHLQVLQPAAPDFTIQPAELAAILARSTLAIRAAFARARRLEMVVSEIAVWLDAASGYAVAMPKWEAEARAFGFWTEADRHVPPFLTTITVKPWLDSSKVLALVVQLPHGLVMTCCDIPRRS